VMVARSQRERASAIRDRDQSKSRRRSDLSLSLSLCLEISDLQRDLATFRAAIIEIVNGRKIGFES